MFRVIFATSLPSAAIAGNSMNSAGTLLLRMADADSAPAFAEYLEGHVRESNSPGMPRFSFYESINREECGRAAAERWARPVQTPNWGRAWLLWNPADSLVIGHLELRGGKIAPTLHRADLSMGLRQMYTGKGLGAILIEQALDWAVNHTSLDWVDLGVFADNLPAQKLYRRMDFKETGSRADEFRLPDGTSIDSILMSRRLR